MTKLLKTTVAAFCLAGLAMLVWVAADAHAFAAAYVERRDATLGTAVAFLALTVAAFLIAAPTALRLTWTGGGRSAHVLGLFAILVAFWPISYGLYLAPGGAMVTFPDLETLAQVLPAATFVWFAAVHSEELGSPIRDRRLLRYAWAAVASGGLSVLLGQHELLAAFPESIALVLLPYMIYKGIRILRELVARVDREEGQRIAWILNGMVISFAVAILAYVLPAGVEGAVLGWGAYTDPDPGIVPVLDRIATVSEGVVPLVLVLAVALSVFYRGSVDSELMLARTTVTSLFGFIFLVLFAVIEQVVSMQLDRFLTITPSIGVFVSAVVAAVIVAPMHRGVHKLAGRIVPERTEAATVSDAPG